jgi:hypothetical protein
MNFNETEAKTTPDENPGETADPEVGQAKPSLEAVEGNPDAGREGTPPADFEERLVEENREYANIYRQNLLSQTAEVVKGLSMMHTMAMRGNKDARQTMDVFWATLRSAGVAFPVNRAQRRKLKALEGGKPNGSELPPSA